MIRRRKTAESKAFLKRSVTAAKRRRQSSVRALSRRLLVLYLLVGLRSISLYGQGSVRGEQSQNSTPPAAPLKADTIFLHGNVYTGVPANSQFSSILRQEAIAVRSEE